MRAFGAYLILLICLGCDDQSAKTAAPTPVNNVAQVDDRLAGLTQASRPATSNMTAATFSPDGGFLVTVNADGTTRLWDVQTGQPGTESVGRVWVMPQQRYDPKRIDNMPVVGPDNFKILQDQIDALEERIRTLEKERAVERQ